MANVYSGTHVHTITRSIAMLPAQQRRGHEIRNIFSLVHSRWRAACSLFRQVRRDVPHRVAAGTGSTESARGGSQTGAHGLARARQPNSTG